MMTMILADDRCIGFTLSAGSRGVRALDHAGQELGYFETLPLAAARVTEAFKVDNGAASRASWL
jgi:hypothetical protein